MKILITNDDGIEAEGIRRLAEWSVTLGEVYIFAPKFEQSGCSQSIDIKNSYEVKRSDVFSDLGIVAYSVDSTPADCVRFAIDKMGAGFDFVFSGINNGYNIGYDIAYSGTCGAGFEANYAGIKAVAFSAPKGSLSQSAQHLPYVWEFLKENDLLCRNCVMNVNIPPEMKQMLITEQGGTFYRDRFENVGGDMYKARLYLTRSLNGPFDLCYDADAVLSGHGSVTPLTVNKTDGEVMRRIKKSE
jgi:5'/3'-nucleotidase SurE